MDELTLRILELVVTIVTLVASRYIIPLLKEQLDQSKMKAITECVEKAVSAAEQIVVGAKTGEEKKQMVLDYVTDILAKKGYTISAQEIDILIEAAVRTINAEKKNNK